MVLTSCVGEGGGIYDTILEGEPILHKGGQRCTFSHCCGGFAFSFSRINHPLGDCLENYFVLLTNKTNYFYLFSFYFYNVITRKFSFTYMAYIGLSGKS